MFNFLSKEEQTEFLKSLNFEPKKVKNFEFLKKAILKNNPNPLSDRCNCPHCQSVNVVKNGNVRGIQRFKCKDCEKTFSYTTNTILYKSNKSIETWEKYCECFLHKFPLRKCAEICGISLDTAFNWRHKILDALQNMQTEVTIKGIVDQMKKSIL